MHKLEMRAAADAVPALVEGAKLSPGLKAALMERLMECRIDRAVSRADLEGSRATEELFRLKNRDVESILRENPGASGFVWKRRERSRVLERRKVPLAAAVREAAASAAPYSIFDISGLRSVASANARDVLDGFHVINEGVLMTFGETFTPFHVEDYAMANVQTLQRAHSDPAVGAAAAVVTAPVAKVVAVQSHGRLIHLTRTSATRR